LEIVVRNEAEASEISVSQLENWEEEEM